jgi:hypothetical protein
MFLHSIATNRAEVVLPWNLFSQHGNSLFVFRVVLGVICFALFLPFIVLGVWTVNQMIAREGSPALLVVRMVLLIFGMVGLGLFFALIKKLTFDFVVPLMFLGTSDCVGAWRQFLTLLADNKARFLLYILFSIVLAVAIGFAVIAIVLLTCCCAGCLLAIPYLGTVLYLPVLIFARSYSLYYLAQYGPGFDVFAHPPGQGLSPTTA